MAQHYSLERWDVSAVRLSDEEPVRLYLRGRGLSETGASEAAKTVEIPPQGELPADYGLHYED